ncbi:MAG: PQQ-dependent sugar dehydrogenase [Gaiellaceae bacterium]
MGLQMAGGGDLGRTQAFVAAVCVAAVVVPDATPGASALGIELVASGLRQPVHVAAAPGEPERLYVVERAGRVRIVDEGRLLPRPFLDIRGRVRSGGLVGLLSIAFHPRYPTDRRAYVMYTAPGGNLVVLELRVREGRARPKRIILSVRVPSSIYAHVGGQLAFGPGGRLHAGIGDGFEPAAAQDPLSALGKVLRLDVDLPLAAPEVVAIGLRNPWRFSFDRRTGDLFIGDVGERAFEEVNVIRRGTRGVPNFGWGAEPPLPDAKPAFVQYAHPARDCAAVIGGFVYRGRELPAARGRYFYGDTCSGRVWSVRAASASPRPRKEPFTVGQLASFGEDAAGELYLVARGEGALIRLAHR